MNSERDPIVIGNLLLLKEIIARRTALCGRIFDQIIILHTLCFATISFLENKVLAKF